MAITKPYRRDIYREPIDTTVDEDDIKKPETLPPKSVLSLTYEQRLQRQIDMLNLSLSKYERVLTAGGELDVHDEKRMVTILDSARKLELAMAQIRARSEGVESQSDLEIAVSMIDKGMTYDVVCRVFKHNLEIPETLKEALRDRAK